MTVRVGINGFGRIGRAFTRLALERADLGVDVVVESTGKFRSRDAATSSATRRRASSTRR